MSISIERAATLTNKTVPDFIEWTQSMEGSDYVINTDGEEVACIYTDSDQGVIYITGYSEIFLEKGVTFSMVEDCSWCDIDIKDFTMMLNEIKELNAL
tara:strand:+ start:1527 stop:1820 length:294 start_codon:yes stop_codon:yes gene_type:complete